MFFIKASLGVGGEMCCVQIEIAKKHVSRVQELTQAPRNVAHGFLGTGNMTTA